MSEQIEATRIEHTNGNSPVVHLSDGSSISLNELIEQAVKWRHAKSPGAVDRAMNREQHANERMRSAEAGEAYARAGERVALNAAATLKHKNGKIIEQAGAWKRRALAAESDLKLAREQASYREGELVRSGHQQLLEAQSKALDTIQRIAAQLPVDPIIDAEVVVPDVEVDTWFGEDDTPVVQIDTHRGHGRLRINLNDGVVWDGDPETDERPGAHAEALPTDHQQDMKATISRQLDTIRDQAEKIETLQGRMGSNLRAFRALEARKVELEAELAENRRAFDAIDGHRRELAELLDQQREAHELRGTQLNNCQAAVREARADVAKLTNTLDQLRAQHGEAIERSNDLLKSMAKAANLRDRQVEALSLLWATKTDDERALFGTVFTRQLYRVFADHGIDVEHDMPAYPANIGALITPAEMPVTDRIIREYNHLREHAELVLQADMRNRGRFLGDGLRSALAGLRDAVNNGAPEPTPDRADCA